MKYKPVIGLEIHAQLLTKSKIFCRCSTKFGGKENEQVCPICLGMPGVLPVLNKRAVEFALKLALVTHCRIARHTIFARKNYFYPDLPKGYQISQFEDPIAEHGYIKIKVNGSSKRIGLTRIHLEEDAGKSMHAEAYVAKDETLVDVNRCGVPLVEIVTEPDLRSPREAYDFLNKLRQMLLYLEICDGNMEEGSLRCDANISIKPEGSKKLGVKTEVKNMNSFHGVKKAIEYEIKRQINVLQQGGHIVQETLLWDADRGVAETMRSKEYAHDYCYFPEPNLVPIEVDENWIQEIHKTLPEMPWQKERRFREQYGLPKYDSTVLTEDKDLADYFEQCTKVAKDSKAVSNWIMSELLRIMNERKIKINEFPVQPQQLGEMINLVSDGIISGKIAKTVFEEMVSTGKDAITIVDEKGLVQIVDVDAIGSVVDTVMEDHPKEIESYLAGKEGLFSFFVGQVMKMTKGKANPQKVNIILRDKFGKLKTNSL